MLDDFFYHFSFAAKAENALILSVLFKRLRLPRLRGYLSCKEEGIHHATTQSSFSPYRLRKNERAVIKNM